jgi:hypothetical protein
MDSVCVCVCVYYEFQLRKVRYCLFLTITCEYTIFLQKFAVHLKPYGGTPVAEHCSILDISPKGYN